VSCGYTPVGDCFPSGSTLDARYSSIRQHPQQGYIAYFSPGIACPAGWTTAGSGARGTAGGAFNLSGILTENYFTNLPSLVEAVPLARPSAVLSVLDPSETVVYCCPRYIPTNLPHPPSPQPPIFSP
jgi:hypothetical protein